MDCKSPTHIWTMDCSPPHTHITPPRPITIVVDGQGHGVGEDGHEEEVVEQRVEDQPAGSELQGRERRYASGQAFGGGGGITISACVCVRLTPPRLDL